jgi:hypothetical protein
MLNMKLQNYSEIFMTETQNGFRKGRSCSKMVPKNLTTEQKANRRDVCLDLLDHLEREPEFFSRVITGDESWIVEYDPETKHQSWEWHTSNSPRQSGDRPQGICATRTNFLLGSP